MKIGVITHSFNKPTKECLYDASSLNLDGVQIYATMGEFSFEELTEEKINAKKQSEEQKD